MDTKSKVPILNGPSLLDMVMSLARKRMYIQGPLEMYLAQCVSFKVGLECWYVLINAMERPALEDEEWLFEGKIIQQGTERCTTWKPCHGAYAVTNRQGWIKEGVPES